MVVHSLSACLFVGRGYISLFAHHLALYGDNTSLFTGWATRPLLAVCIALYGMAYGTLLAEQAANSWQNMRLFIGIEYGSFFGDKISLFMG